jgi:hypothetical protein
MRSLALLLVLATGCTSPRGRSLQYAGGAAMTFVGTALTLQTLSRDECNDPSADLISTAGCAGAQAGAVMLPLMLVAVGVAVIAGTAVTAPDEPAPRRAARVRPLSTF